LKATFALLAPTAIQNLVHHLAWEAHTLQHITTLAARLPAHVSLKISFDVSDLAVLENYMDQLASQTPPLKITLTELQLIEMGQTGILWLDVIQTPGLRRLHFRILKDLCARLGEAVRVEPDGKNYHFHMTVAMGKPLKGFQLAFAAMQTCSVRRSFTARQLCLFLYDDQGGRDEDYITYKILPLKSHPEVDHPSPTNNQ
jgi:2'-5' RNA ligase